MTTATDVTAVPIGRRVRDLAATRPDAPAVTCGDDTVTWADLDRRTNRMARALADAGVDQGRFVTIALPNGVGFVLVCVAVWKLGAVPQPVSWRLPEAELAGVVDLADPPVVVGPVAVPGRRAVLPEELEAGGHGDGPLPDRVSPSWKAPTSGGSTGRPKLIVSGTPGVVEDRATRFWRCGADDTLLMPGPMFHNGPFASAFAGFLEGGHLVLLPRFDAAATLREVERHRATWLYLVPTMMNRIWRLPEERRAAHDLSSLRTVWHLAAPCPPWLKHAWIDWLGPERIWELYGGTESIATTVIAGTEWLDRPGSVGRPAYGEIAVLGPDGRRLPPGEVGEVYMRRDEGVPATYRYIGAEARSLGEWESLGDLGSLDADGFLYLADRRTDMILVGGENVYPAEVEAALEEHPDVLSCAVVGLPDDDLGQAVHAIVQARDGRAGDALRDELDRWAGERLERMKRPRSVEFVDVPLRDDAGKVRRSALRAERIGTPRREAAG
ncbi:AMP-binding protein [Actinomadura rugatobispora]|uniref:AMP-binding protein n=1 Tax=Actinomadura rugatobispora TaxID=1994 RepID=A0ABW1AH63_9ACTN|nr:AMP-binding protein [Actinomadura rugatobispora]